MTTLIKHVYLFLFVIASFIFLFHYFITGQAVYGDGIGYYAHLRNWYFDQDFDYTNEYKHNYTPQNNNVLEPTVSTTVQIVGTTPSGRAANHYSTGVAMLLLPSYVMGDVVVTTVNFFGANLSRTGYSDVYQIVSGLGAVFYTICGIFLLEKIINFYCKDQRVSRLSAVTIFFATPLLYYGSFDVLNSHFASFFLTTAFLYLLLTKKNNTRNNFFLGLVGGLLFSTRIQDGLLILLWIAKKTFTIKKELKNILVFMVSFVMAVLPLFFHWQQTFGNILNHTYINSFLNERSQGKTISWLGSLFDPTIGLLVATPILLLLVAYFFYLLIKRKNTVHLQPLFIFFCLQYLVITIHGGWTAAAYGGRMYISTLPFFGLILGEFLVFINNKDRHHLGVLLCAVFAILNILNMGYFIVFKKGAEGGRTGTEVRTQERLEKLKLKF